MKIKGHGTIKKSKAYGVIGTLLLSAALIVSFGNESVSADEELKDYGLDICLEKEIL